MTQIKCKIKKGDTVQVTAGKHKGRRGTVQKVLLDEGRLIIEGVNVVTRHMRPSQTNPSGTEEKTKSIHVSNALIVDPSTDKPARVGIQVTDGKRVRVFKKSGKEVGAA